MTGTVRVATTVPKSAKRAARPEVLQKSSWSRNADSVGGTHFTNCQRPLWKCVGRGDSSPPGSEVKRLHRGISERRTTLSTDGELSVRLIDKFHSVNPKYVLWRRLCDKKASFSLPLVLTLHTLFL